MAERKSERQGRASGGSDKSAAARDVTDKLGLAPGQRVRVLGKGDLELIEKVRRKIERGLSHASHDLDMILYWPRSTYEITTVLKSLGKVIKPAGAIWVITPKKGKTNRLRAPHIPDKQLIPLGLEAGLVDNKVCSVSENETAVRFVIRLKDRA